MKTFQVQQQLTIDCILKRGAGIRLTKGQFKAPKIIVKALGRVLGDPSYMDAFSAIRKEIDDIDGGPVAEEKFLAFTVSAARTCRR